MKNKGIIQLATAALAILIAAPAAGSQATAGGEKPRTVRGEVVEVRQTVQTANQAAFTEIKVRTRQNEESWFRLGPAAQYGNRFQAGDRIRARVTGGGGGDAGPASVREISNHRTGDRLKVRSADGTLLREKDRDRLRDGTGAGDQDRDRTRQRDRQDRPGDSNRSSRGGGGHRSGGGR
jgi:uncharacterized membrane protein YgcG